ncbi:MAG: hypothetical protein KJ755_21145 [Alphaproteobacteria bacterium]|nr:hypothetical protein [Gammaproteobacteria bacterium]MBU0852226.1 hypothetical protein [Gammaproteobacteria bacterium]MBU1461710.1 hypothetical protein [Gammaproteobacteria bacterium]MBU1772781.1 hypothetical protein [Gammaproteobacteria bacterium]MBU2329832.1 hypothetical protein [Alphaproteobacteria bacterium]|tara:strand:+ start:2408 stop:2779 length:372 start_codon:yes stop_codon:yes gene_type:complete
MDDIDTEPLVREVARLKALQIAMMTEIAQPRGSFVKVTATMIGCGAGLFGVVATLHEGLRWEWAIAIAIGATAYHLARQSEKGVAARRERLDQITADLEQAEQRWRSATAKERLLELFGESSS